MQQVKENVQTTVTPVKRKSNAKDAFKTKTSPDKVAKPKTSPKSKSQADSSTTVSKKKATKTEESLPNLKALNKAVAETP